MIESIEEEHADAVLRLFEAKDCFEKEWSFASKKRRKEIARSILFSRLTRYELVRIINQHSNSQDWRNHNGR